jgi:hypothetical protein
MNRREVLVGAAATVAAAALPAVPAPDTIIGAVYRYGTREIAIGANIVDVGTVVGLAVDVSSAKAWVWREEWTPITPG